MTNQEQVLELYTAMFNRAADISGLNYWVNEMDNNSWTIADVASSFAQQTEYQTAFPASDHQSFITTIYQNLLGRAPEQQGLDYWVGELQTGKITPEHATLAIINGAKDNDSAQAALDAQFIANKTTVSSFFSQTLKLNNMDQAISVMSNVSADVESVNQAKSSLQTFVADSYDADALGLFEGHQYLLFNDAKSHDQALSAAQQLGAGSALVKIETQAENDFLLALLSENNVSSTAQDGGGATYVWIGASDKQVEGQWVWADGTALDYSNWGAKNGATEPDNFDSSVVGGIYTGQQDAAAIALTDWPVGITGQWNDVDGVNTLAYVVEIG